MTAQSAVALFRSKSNSIVARLLGDFPIRAEDGCAITGNGGHECKGFTALQEIKPTVKGSRGGWGWFQWTGPRRRAFEAYCKRNTLDPSSDEANYAWLFLELKGAEARAIPAVLDADGLDMKVEAFERAFLRAGVKHYPSRIQWARIAMDEWECSGQKPAPTPVARQRDMLVDEAGAADGRAEGDTRRGTLAGGGGLTGTGGGTAIAVTQGGPQLADLLLIGLGVAALAGAAWLLLRARAGAKASGRLRAAVAALPGQPFGTGA